MRTPREKVGAIFERCGHGPMGGIDARLLDAIARAIEEAVADEREACAVVGALAARLSPAGARAVLAADVAEAIRARGGGR